MQKLINVAVAVLKFDNEFLLARRSVHQHQGGKLEFVGGKMEAGESELSALVREVDEELGLDIADNDTLKLGDIVHDYGDKCVKLCVYLVNLNERQAIDFKQKTHGADGQELHWLIKQELLVSTDKLPEANVQILEWLQAL